MAELEQQQNCVLEDAARWVLGVTGRGWRWTTHVYGTTDLVGAKGELLARVSCKPEPLWYRQGPAKLELAEELVAVLGEVTVASSSMVDMQREAIGLVWAAEGRAREVLGC